MEMEVHRFPESGLEFISRPVKERLKVARCPQECWRDQLGRTGRNRILNLVRVVGENSEERAGMSHRLIIILRCLETTWHGPSRVNARCTTKRGIRGSFVER